ncbi:helix-turn-helix transcriptional regulator [Mesorhizobium sp. M0199]|uniref:helix-turn-helix transcriptional regulator n=1 Tax=Mesorhizobium sp. M0199 TaxID=2956911 RepID=UPI00333C3114
MAWLAHSGLIFDPEMPSDLQRKVRLMIGAAPERTWISKDLAQSLALSEATFRRRLADQGQSFKDLLIDVRMTAALTLLQVTDRPISEVAYQVGYESASRFSVRFKKRFGFSPTAVRGVPSRRPIIAAAGARYSLIDQCKGLHHPGSTVLYLLTRPSRRRRRGPARDQLRSRQRGCRSHSGRYRFPAHPACRYMEVAVTDERFLGAPEHKADCGKEVVYILTP